MNVIAINFLFFNFVVVRTLRHTIITENPKSYTCLLSTTIFYCDRFTGIDDRVCLSLRFKSQNKVYHIIPKLPMFLRGLQNYLVFGFHFHSRLQMLTFLSTVASTARSYRRKYIHNINVLIHACYRHIKKYPSK